jgi:TPR repeat protein
MKKHNAHKPGKPFQNRWLFSLTSRLLRFWAIALILLLNSSVLLAQNQELIARKKWQQLASFEKDWSTDRPRNNLKDKFKTCSKDGTILAIVRDDALEYRDAFNGTMLSQHPTLGCRTACVSANRSQLYLCKLTEKTANVKSVIFGSGFVSETLSIPVSINLEHNAIEGLIQHSEDGKYLFIVIHANADTRRSELIVWNTNESRVELSIIGFIYLREDSLLAYDSNTETLAVNTDGYTGSIINISNGTRVQIEDQDPLGKEQRRFLEHLQFIDGRLIELGKFFASEIDTKTGKRHPLAQGIDDAGLDVSKWGASFVFRDTRNDQSLYVLPKNITFQDFKDEIINLTTKGISEDTCLMKVKSNQDSIQTSFSFVDAEIGIYTSNKGALWRRIDDENRKTISEFDCKELAKFWQRGFESKTFEWFKNKGEIRRNSWQSDYSENCPYAACLLGISLATGADGARSVEKGKRFLAEAIDRGYKDAAVWLALFETDRDKIFQVLSSAREGASPLVLESLAQCYREGLGCDVDLNEALKLSTTAADMQGGGVSAIRVAKIYEEGLKTVKAVALINSGGEAIGSWQEGKKENAFKTAEKIDVSSVRSPAPEEVYQSVALSEKFENAKLSWSIPASSGNYTLRLHFTEPFENAEGKRKLDIKIQNSITLKDFDIYATTGSRFKATVLEFPVRLNEDSDVSLEIISRGKNSAIISGIELLSEETTGAASPIEPNPVMVFSYFNKAAKAKALDSEYYLAMCYLNGVGVEASNEEAFKWLQEGIASNSVLAKYGMGLCLASGVGCEKDVVGAFQLFCECAEQGVEAAKNSASSLQAEAEEIERDRRLKWELRRRASKPSQKRTSAAWDVNEDARAAVRDYRNKVSGFLGVNGLIFRGGY